MTGAWYLTVAMLTTSPEEANEAVVGAYGDENQRATFIAPLGGGWYGACAQAREEDLARLQNGNPPIVWFAWIWESGVLAGTNHPASGPHLGEVWAAPEDGNPAPWNGWLRSLEAVGLNLDQGTEGTES